MATYIKGDAVANATSYELYEKVGTSYNLKATASEINFNLDNLNFEAGDHVLVVKAKADGYEDSDYSNEVTYTVAEPVVTGNFLTTSSDEILQDSNGNYLEFMEEVIDVEYNENILIIKQANAIQNGNEVIIDE